jgi:hypothetical protein
LLTAIAVHRGAAFRTSQVASVVAVRHPDVARHIPGVVAVADPALDVAEAMLAATVPTLHKITWLKVHKPTIRLPNDKLRTARSLG